MAKRKLNLKKYHAVVSFVLDYKAEHKRFPSYKQVSVALEIPFADAETYCMIIENKDKLDLSTDEDLRRALNRKSKALQKCRDIKRMDNKDIREHDRLPNAIEELHVKMCSLLESHKMHEPFSYDPKNLQKILGNPLSKTGVIQISDWHLNELINLPGINSFNFHKASKMIKKLVTYSIWKFKALDVENIVVASVGDLINSDRRIEEKLQMASNRTKASFIAVELVRAMLLELSYHFKHVYFAGVTGNESRVADELGWSEIMMTDNYDYSIYKTLEFLFKDHEKVHVMDQSEVGYVEVPITISGHTWLLVHGHTRTLMGDVEKGVIQLVGKWSDHGYKIVFVLSGHLHYTRIGDHFARGASLPGANAYSNKALQLITKSAQNIHTAFTNGDIFNERVDLSNIDDIIGYKFNEDLIAYNTKSQSKSRQGKTILEIKI